MQKRLVLCLAEYLVPQFSQVRSIREPYHKGRCLVVAKQILKDVSIVINSVNLADHCSAVSMDDTADEIDFTGFSSAGYKEYGQGLKDGTVTVTIFQDFAAGSVHATLQPLSGASFPVVLKPTSAAVSATNPSLTMTAKLYSYAGLDGSVGEASIIEATFRNASSTGLVWATS